MKNPRIELSDLSPLERYLLRMQIASQVAKTTRGFGTRVLKDVKKLSGDIVKAERIKQKKLGKF